MPSYYLEEEDQQGLLILVEYFDSGFQVDEQIILDQLLEVPRVQHVLPRTTLTRQREDENYFDDEEEDKRDDINPKLVTWPPVSQGLVQAIRQNLLLIFVGWGMPIEDSTTEKAAVVRVPAPPPHQCPLVAAIQALLLPGVTGILLLVVAWRRRSTNSKTAPRTDLLPLQVERSKVADWSLV
ncbi:hypothetical protein T492DRAFT_16371 [Pavlovales sp. CCMP2436]|nr:hypothetical protein T492DRAFT_16371 [Pavlovales sp. CCMP2436]